MNLAACQLDAFVVRPVATDPGVFDDGWDRAQAFWGVYASAQKPMVGILGRPEVYYFGLKSESVRYDQGTDRETRHTLGARAKDTKGGFDYWLEGRFSLARLVPAPFAPGNMCRCTSTRSTALSYARGSGSTLRFLAATRIRAIPTSRRSTRCGQRSGAHFVGTLGQLELAWRLNPHATAMFQAGRYWVGEYFRDTPPARDLTYLSAKVSYRF